RPSSIYWAGLRTLQIIKQPYSLAEFCRYVDQLNSLDTRTASGAAVHLHDGDDATPVQPHELIADLPASSNWPEKVHIDLEHEEATFLIERLSNAAMPPTSIPAQLIRSNLMFPSPANSGFGGSQQAGSASILGVLEATTFEQLNAFLQQLLQGN